MAPLCWAAVALVLAVPAYAVSRRRGAVLTIIAMAALFLGFRFQAQSPSRIAVAVVAMIIGAVVVRAVGARWLASPRRAAAAVLGAVGIGLVLGASGIGSAERPRQPSGAAPAAAPDVVVVFLDTVPYDSIFPRWTGVDPRLPFLAGLAAQSIVFDRAYTPSPWTLPAHFSAVTGVPAHRLGVDFDHQQYEGQATPLAARFRRRGYRTAAVISNTFLNPGTGFARGFDSYEHASNALDVCRTVPGALLDRWSPWFAASVCNWTAGEVTGRAIGQLARDDRPLFLLLNYMDAHDPFYVERGCERPAGGNPRPREVPPNEYRARYYASHLAAVRCIDRQLGALAAHLDRRKRDAVIAVLADHGEQFGEHGLVRHGNSLYDRLLHVPFMIKAPRAAPRHVTEPVSIEALPRLLAELGDRGSAGTPGGPVFSSLFPPAAIGSEEQWSLIRGRWHFIARRDGNALYDLAADPAEERNLATSPAAASTLRELSTEVAREKQSRVDRRSGEFRSLGYIR